MCRTGVGGIIALLGEGETGVVLWKDGAHRRRRGSLAVLASLVVIVARGERQLRDGAPRAGAIFPDERLGF